MRHEEATIFAKQIHPLRRLFTGEAPRPDLGGVLCGGDNGVLCGDDFVVVDMAVGVV